MNRKHTPSGLLEQDPSIYQKLIDTYSKLLWTIAAGILSGGGSQEDVEEVVADVFIDLWKHPEAYEPQRAGSGRTSVFAPEVWPWIGCGS